MCTGMTAPARPSAITGWFRYFGSRSISATPEACSADPWDHTDVGGAGGSTPRRRALRTEASAMPPTTSATSISPVATARQARARFFWGPAPL